MHARSAPAEGGAEPDHLRVKCRKRESAPRVGVPGRYRQTRFLEFRSSTPTGSEWMQPALWPGVTLAAEMLMRLLPPVGSDSSPLGHYWRQASRIENRGVVS